MAEIEDLEKRVSQLERRLRDTAIVATSLALAMVLFMGFTWKSIPRKAAEALQNETVKEAEKQAQSSAASAESAASSAAEMAGRAKSAAESAEEKASRIERIEGERISDLEVRLTSWASEHTPGVVVPYGNFGDRWFDLKCRAGEIVVGYGFEISAFINASGPGVDREGKTRVPQKFRIHCARR